MKFGKPGESITPGKPIRSWKQTLKILLLFALLLAAAAVPTFFVHCQNQYYFNKINRTSVQAEDLEDSVKTYDLWDRLKILNRAAVVQTQSSRDSQHVYYYDYSNKKTVEVASDTGTGSATDETIKKQLARRAQQQLRKLKNYQELPDIPFSELTDLSFFRQTYMDMENPGHVLSIWRIYMEYPQLVVNLYMDTETSALCQVELFPTDGETFLYEKEELSAEGFLAYLNTFSKSSGKRGADEEEWFQGKGVFSEDHISLYCASSAQEGKRTVLYCFDPPF